MQKQPPEYAGFWIRVGAYIVDTILIVSIIFPVRIWLYGWSYFDPDVTGLIAGPADFFISWVLPAVWVIAFWRYKQATPGKMLVSVKVMDARTGQPASMPRLIGRYFAYLVSIIPLCLGILWVAFDKRKQGWHDKLAGTIVVKK